MTDQRDNYMEVKMTLALSNNLSNPKTYITLRPSPGTGRAAALELAGDAVLATARSLLELGC
jgi:hypothetical protein